MIELFCPFVRPHDFVFISAVSVYARHPVHGKENGQVVGYVRRPGDFDLPASSDLLLAAVVSCQTSEPPWLSPDESSQHE